jgi:hypothetical protein
MIFTNSNMMHFTPSLKRPIDGSKIPSIRKFTCAYTEKYFRLNENLRASKRKFNRLEPRFLQDCQDYKIQQQQNPDNQENLIKIKVQTINNKFLSK